MTDVDAVEVKTVLGELNLHYKFILSYDCKTCLAGMPNAYFDCSGRPFGLVEELNYVGWPSKSDEDTLKVSNLIVKCTPREGEEGGWIYAHHCCASWSNGVHFNDQVSKCLFFNLEYYFKSTKSMIYG